MAMRNIDRGWVWRWCLRHYESKFNTKHRKPTLKARLWNLGLEGNVRKFEAKKAEWLEIHDEQNVREPKWVNEELALWSLAYDNIEGGGARWGTMMTNAQECVNGVLKGVRRLPMSSVVEHTFHCMVKYWHKRREEYEAMLAEGNELTMYCQKLTKESTTHSVTHYVLSYDADNGVYKVKSAPNNQNRSGSNNYVVRVDTQSNRKG
ncbi:hypothetical protein LINPERHAP1_LOCUS6733, partial [Linum perenne]